MAYNEYGDLETTTYANGASINYVYDYRELQSVELRDSANGAVTHINYGYTGTELTSVTQVENDVTQLSYSFSDSETQSATSVSGAVNAVYTYNYSSETGNLLDRTVRVESGDFLRTDIFSYDSDGGLTSVGDGLFKTAYTYDGYDRLSSRKV